MSGFKKGDSVRQVVKPIEGVVDGFQVDQESGEVLNRVSWTDGEGTHSRFFKASELEAAKV